MKIPDLNCDLGEHESSAIRAALMECIDSANIACGGHAGNRATMEHAIALALDCGVRIGAHPGLAADGGRGGNFPTCDELKQLLDQQVLPFAALVESAKGRLHHIKLHGTLYHATDQVPDLARVYLEWCQRHFPAVRIYARSGGATARMAGNSGISCWRECFLDRAYEADASLRPRHHDNAAFQDRSQLEQRLTHWLSHGEILSHDGIAVSLGCETFCLHSDGPHALEFARYAHNFLQRAII
jgi:5-oxoprolinase (ATP-hydrolysing) subunit A